MQIEHTWHHRTSLQLSEDNHKYGPTAHHLLHWDGFHIIQMEEFHSLVEMGDRPALDNKNPGGFSSQNLPLHANFSALSCLNDGSQLLQLLTRAP